MGSEQAKPFPGDSRSILISYQYSSSFFVSSRNFGISKSANVDVSSMSLAVRSALLPHTPTPRGAPSQGDKFEDTFFR